PVICFFTGKQSPGMTKLRLRRLPGGLTEVHVKVPALEMQQVQYFLAMCEEADVTRSRRRADRMRRRQFITLLGGSAVAWPLAARAQHRQKVRRIGVLMRLAADDPEGQARLLVFAQALQQLGWTVDRNVRIDIRSDAADDDRLRRYAEELVALEPDAI